MDTDTHSTTSFLVTLDICTQALMHGQQELLLRLTHLSGVALWETKLWTPTHLTTPHTAFVNSIQSFQERRKKLHLKTPNKDSSKHHVPEDMVMGLPRREEEASPGLNTLLVLHKNHHFQSGSNFGKEHGRAYKQLLSCLATLVICLGPRGKIFPCLGRTKGFLSLSPWGEQFSSQ